MKFLIYDAETTISNKGNPFDGRNKHCYSGFRYAGEKISDTKILNHLKDGPCIDIIQEHVNNATYLVAFNAKFDCHWLENIGVDLSHIRIWDCQFAEYLLSRQLTKYPSLNGTCEKYGLGSKIDVIAEKYWDKGIDTADIPPNEIIEYLKQDIVLTEKLFFVLKDLLQQQGLMRLFQLHMEDQHCLREMEKNGILYSVDDSNTRAQLVAKQLEEIEHELRKEYENIPINFDSGDHLSSYLYGGKIEVETRIPVGVYKSGAKLGQTRYSIITHAFILPKLFQPIKGSELKKDGYFATDERTIEKLRGNKEAKKRISLLDKRAKLEKLRGTYYEGFPKTIAAMGWVANFLHPSYNQCVAVTGRLSSTKPNAQNIPPEAKQLCLSRYAN